MKTYETTTIVEDRGQVHLSGVPFEPGTQVDVIVTAAHNGADEPGRASRLFAALDKARNTESVGPLKRDELYDRDILR